ncbi:MAG: 1-acyl-sn-glycerol-3-phosphate acyltransferase, partial [Lewinellaceae bacterium]|nr:1-acyl-sn-glycerol-3-phosphate acyltransferase [Lewinellaceae bacterium]
CIPVKRAEDVSPGEQRDNTDAFLQSYEHLEQHGVLFIAPEGTSWMNRFVRPLKTGTARIALGAEHRNNWLLGLKIIPVGHSYTAPHLFRSEVVVQAGKPVVVADWADQYRENQVAAVDALTEYLEQQLKSLSIHTRDETGEAMITQLEEILINESPLPQQESFYRSQSLAARFLDDHVLANLLEDYQDSLKKQGLSDAAICFSNKRAPWWLLPALMAGLPFFLLGYLLWWLPCFVPAWITKRMNLYVGYGAIAKTLLGLFTFPLAMWGVYHLGKWLGGQAWFGVVAVLFMVVLGYFTEKYLDWWQRFRNHAAGAALHRHHQQEWAAAQRARESLLSYIA